MVHCCNFTSAFSSSRELTIHHRDVVRITYGKITRHATYTNWWITKNNKIFPFQTVKSNSQLFLPYIPQRSGRYKSVNFPHSIRLGVVACSCDPATWRPESVDGVRAGVLLSGDLCWAGVRTKIGINMGTPRELGVTRLSKEGRTGPGWKHSRQKSPCRSVVGSRLWIDTC